MATRNVLTKLTRLAVDDVYLVERPGCHPFDSQHALSAFDAGCRDKDESKSKTLETFRQCSICFNLFVFLAKHVILLFSWGYFHDVPRARKATMAVWFWPTDFTGWPWSISRSPATEWSSKNCSKFRISVNLRSEASSIRLSYLGPDTQDEMKAITLTESRFHTVMYCSYIMDMTGCVGKYTTSLICLVIDVLCHLWNSKLMCFIAFMFACFRWFPRRFCGAVLAPCKWASTPSSTPGPPSIAFFASSSMLSSLRLFPDVLHHKKPEERHHLGPKASSRQVTPQSCNFMDLSGLIPEPWLQILAQWSGCSIGDNQPMMLITKWHAF